jgi:hypothetical protein
MVIWRFLDQDNKSHLWIVVGVHSHVDLLGLVKIGHNKKL